MHAFSFTFSWIVLFLCCAYILIICEENLYLIVSFWKHTHSPLSRCATVLHKIEDIDPCLTWMNQTSDNVVNWVGLREWTRATQRAFEPRKIKLEIEFDYQTSSSLSSWLDKSSSWAYKRVNLEQDKTNLKISKIRIILKARKKRRSNWSKK